MWPAKAIFLKNNVTKLDSAIAEVPTGVNVSTAGIH
jgi:hypothetical protein